MFEVITKWNLTQPDSVMDDFKDSISLRGYNKETSFLPAEFSSLLINEQIKSLSVGDISDRICPTQRDLYFKKGINKVKAKDEKTWGRRVGNIVERYYYDLLASNPNSFSDVQTFHQKLFCENSFKNYDEIIKDGSEYFNEYNVNLADKISELKELELLSTGSKQGDTDWLLKLLNSSGRAEFALNLLHNALNKAPCITPLDVKVEQEIHPNTLNIGISNLTIPDFIIPNYSIVGDIKTGEKFELKYQLTCTGYALAYENETGRDINWGIIYFIPTRVSYQYAQVFNYPQVHIFPINEKLRQWFLDNRDDAYRIISQNVTPNFPEENQRLKCPYCKYVKFCTQQGLILE